MRLLITGGAGCLGSAIVREFLAKSEGILVVDNLSTGHKEWLPSRTNLMVREGDVRDGELLETVFRDFRPTHVVHAAGSYADPNDWVGDLETNTLGSMNVARVSEKWNVSHLVYLQTALAYGTPTITPIPATHQLSPKSSYAISKVGGERYALGADIPVSVSLRVANTCAPHLSIGPLPTFYKNILAGTTSKVSPAERDFLDVEDFLNLLDCIFDSNDPQGASYNVSTGKGRTIQEVFETVRGLLGRPDAPFELMPLREDDISSVVLDPTLTCERFDWKPQKDFEETVSRQIGWFEQHGVGALRSHFRGPRDEKDEKDADG